MVGGGEGEGARQRGQQNTQVVVERKGGRRLAVALQAMTAARDAQMEVWVLPERPQDCRW